MLKSLHKSNNDHQYNNHFKSLQVHLEKLFTEKHLFSGSVLTSELDFN